MKNPKSVYISSGQMEVLRAKGFKPEPATGPIFSLAKSEAIIRFMNGGTLEYATVPAEAVRACTGRTRGE
jgi:hypothetical protein